MTSDVERRGVDADRRIRTSRSAMVAVSVDGIALPRTTRMPATPLDLVGLDLLARLSPESEVAAVAADAVAARFGLTTDVVLGLVSLLVERGALVADGEPDGHAPSPTSSHPTPVDLPEAKPVGSDEHQVLTVPPYSGSAGQLRAPARRSPRALARGWSGGASSLEPCSSDDAYGRFLANPSARWIGRPSAPFIADFASQAYNRSIRSRTTATRRPPTRTKRSVGT
jgi:hypothetical protein